MRHHYLTIEMPWPLAELSPNAREHWASKAGVVKSARSMAHMICFENCVKTHGHEKVTEPLRIVLTFNPPTKRHFDLDNLISRTKSFQDGVFDYLGLDDNLIVSLEARRGEKVKGGSVVITIQGDDDGF